MAQAAESLARAGDRMGAPNPAVPKVLFVRMLADEFMRAIRASGASILRAQSERVPLVRQLSSERMGEASILQAPEIIGAWNH